jgi:hypothetical protein
MDTNWTYSKITFHVPKNVGKCEGMNSHTPKWALTLRIEVSMDSQMLKEEFQRLKFIRLKSSLYHGNVFETRMFKMGLHDPFEFLKHKLWLKKRSGAKVPIWLLITKSQESS